MRICIPAETKEGLNAPVFGHFGSAPFFTIYDTDNERMEFVNNTNAHHDHGMCHPVGVIGDLSVNAVICPGMGRRAVEKLNAAGIKVFRQDGGTVGELIARYKANQLQEMTIENACGHHGCHG